MTDKSTDLIAELKELQEKVTGITGVVVSAVDGLLVAADTGDGIDGECLSALAAAALGLAHRAGEATGRSRLRWSAARFEDGYVMVRPVGDMGVLTLLGLHDVDLARLDGDCEQAVRRIDRLLAAPRASAGHT